MDKPVYFYNLLGRGPIALINVDLTGLEETLPPVVVWSGIVFYLEERTDGRATYRQWLCLSDLQRVRDSDVANDFRTPSM